MQATLHATTILAVRRDDKAVLAGDGQVTLGNTIVKHGARKIRRLYQDRVLAGFAGSAADSFALFERFESKLEQHPRQPRALGGRACQGLAHGSRSSPSRGHARRRRSQVVVSPVGHRRSDRARRRHHRDWSGGGFAQAAAKALGRHTELSPREIAERAMAIAGEMCIYTNSSVTIEEL
jgi:ATP-dependent HslUV protease subunit HslV